MGRAKSKEARIRIQQLAGQIEIYKLEVGKYPDSLQSLVKQPAGVDRWNGPYAKDADLKDAWGNDYRYTVPGTGQGPSTSSRSAPTARKAARARTATSATDHAPRHSRKAGPVSRQRAFTLLEVIVVLVLGAAIYAVLLSAPLGKASAADLKAAARTLASGLRQAQSTAMATRRDALLTLDMESREFVTTGGDEQARKLPDNIDLKLYTAQTEVTSERRGSIRFYPDGSSTGGRITVASGERKYLVDVDWLTGPRLDRRMSDCAERRSRNAAAGFTLIEVVVAFVLLTLVLAVSFEIFSRGMARAGDLEDNSRALVVAQSRLALAASEELKEGESAGDSDDRRFHWANSVRRYEEAVQVGPTAPASPRPASTRSTGSTSA